GRENPRQHGSGRIDELRGLWRTRDLLSEQKALFLSQGEQFQLLRRGQRGEDLLPGGMLRFPFAWRAASRRGGVVRSGGRQSGSRRSVPFSLTHRDASNQPV